MSRRRARCSRHFDADDIKYRSSLSYGLDSEDDGLTETCDIQQYAEEPMTELSPCLWKLSREDSWINWKNHLYIQKIALFCILLIIVFVLTAVITGSARSIIPKELKVQIQVNDEEKYTESILDSSQKINEVLRPEKTLSNDDMSTGEGETSLFQLYKADKFNFSHFQPLSLNIISYINKCKRSLALQNPAESKNDTQNIQHNKPIPDHHKEQELSELNKKVVDLENKLNKLSATLGKIQMDIMYREIDHGQLLPEENKLRKIVQEEIKKKEEEKLGLPDFALESSGGNVIDTPNTKTYTTSSAIQLFGFPLWFIETSPRNAIQASVDPGECWTFHGSVGNLKIQLAAPTIISGFSLYHIPKRISLTGEITSAPKEFSVVGFLDLNESDIEILLGEYEYDENGLPQQTFPVQREETQPFNVVELRIQSNYGSEDFTCVYRFQVHGNLVT